MPVEDPLAPEQREMISETIEEPRGRVIRLYVIPGSNPSIAAELMLRHKGIDYRRRDLIHVVHIPIVKALGFPGRTVPALKSDGRKVQGSRAIARFLDELKPEPSLFPADPATP